MVGTILLAFIFGLLGGIIGALFVPHIQAKYLHNMSYTSLAGDNREKIQDKRIADVEQRFTTQVQQLLRAWHTWESKDDLRFEEFKQQHEAEQAQLVLEREIARVPLIEEIPLSLLFEDKHDHASTNWQPARLEGADLTNRDFSHRFLRRANLRNARLINTNFFMAELSGADLSGANLCGADLSGANLKGVDLRNANLNGANLRVADLQNALLTNAAMQETRNLTAEQRQSAYFAVPIPQQTAFDVDMTTPRAPSASRQYSGIDEQTISFPAIGNEERATGVQDEAPILTPSAAEQATYFQAQTTTPTAGEENVTTENEANNGTADIIMPTSELCNESATQEVIEHIDHGSTEMIQVNGSEVADTFQCNGASELERATDGAILNDLPVTPAPSDSPLPFVVENTEFEETESAAEPPAEPSSESEFLAALAPEPPVQQTEPMQRVATTANMMNPGSAQRKRKHSSNMRGRR